VAETFGYQQILWYRTTLTYLHAQRPPFLKYALMRRSIRISMSQLIAPAWRCTSESRRRHRDLFGCRLSSLLRTLGKETMNKMNSHGTFANGGRHPLYAAGTRVPHRKDSWHACFKQQRGSFDRP
jgi:hypothetical protein